VTTQTTQASAGLSLPRVNLLPPEIEEAERFRRLQLGLAGAVILSAVLVGGLYMHAKSGLSSAQSQLSTAQAQQATEQQKLNSLASVGTTYAEVSAKHSELQQAMGQEIRWSYVLNDLSLRIPSNVWLTNATANESGTPGATGGAAPAASTATGAAAGIGSVSFEGVAFQHDDVAAWLNALAREKGFDSPTFSSSSESMIGSRKVVDFTTSANVTSKALSNRYTSKAGS
jgi:Tfp pilus assembly protein PilN